MKIKNILLVGLLAVASFSAYAQDLIDKVPQDANVILTFDTEKFFSLIPIKDFNSKFTEIGIFDKLNTTLNTPINDLSESGFNLNAKSYYFVRKTDSITFMGALIPLNNAKQFKNILAEKAQNIVVVDGLETIYVDNGSVRLSWDQSTLYILSGTLNGSYFNQADVRKSHGLSELVTMDYSDYDYSDYDYSDDESDSADWESVDFDELSTIDSIGIVDTAIADEDWFLEDSIEADIDADDNEIDLNNIEEDSVYEDDQVDYDDESYLESMRITSQDDSIKNIIKANWINQEMKLALAGNRTFEAKFPPFANKLKNNVVAHLYVADINRLYADLLPIDMEALYGVTGNKFDLGFRSLSYDFIVDNNELKISGGIEVSNEMAPYFRDIYKSKINPKFLKYVTPDDLGFFSFHYNTAAYINYIPVYMNRYKEMLGGKISSFYELGSILFDVLLDENAIAKMYKGDNLFVLNGLTQKEITYVDYDYDEDYNATEVERKKMETIPSFLYMFGSEDQRLFKKLLQLGIKENAIVENNGLFTILTKEKAMPEIYVILKNGFVVLGNDINKMTSIKDDTFKGKTSHSYSKMIKNNNLAMVFSLNKLPDMLKNLDMPIPITMKQTVESLASYGDVTLTSPKMKGNNLYSELSIAFPKEQNNALNFLFDYITTLIGDAK